VEAGINSNIQIRFHLDESRVHGNHGPVVFENRSIHFSKETRHVIIAFLNKKICFTGNPWRRHSPSDPIGSCSQSHFWTPPPAGLSCWCGQWISCAAGCTGRRFCCKGTACPSVVSCRGPSVQTWEFSLAELWMLEERFLMVSCKTWNVNDTT